jgi:hypothetical protein
MHFRRTLLAEIAALKTIEPQRLSSVSALASAKLKTTGRALPVVLEV